MTLAELHRTMTARLAQSGNAAAALDARWLLAGVLGLDRAAVLTSPSIEITAEAQQDVERALQRRLGHEPVSRILRSRSFHGHDLEISPATLDPRPDTETLVDGVLALVHAGRCSGAGRPRIVDVGTGSGAILIALLRALPEAVGVAVDIDGDALRVAGRNTTRHGLDRRLSLKRSQWLEAVEGPFDLVLSNPPYIATSEIENLDADVREFDPRLALDGGPDGLDAYRALVPQAIAKLSPGGWLALEIGLGQAGQVAEIVKKSAHVRGKAEICYWSDLSGRTRCVAARPLKA